MPLLTAARHLRHQRRERVIVSQLHRSPGVVFEEATHPNGQRLISARIIPFRGSWVEFTVDIHDVIYVHIDKKKKFLATALAARLWLWVATRAFLRLFFAVRTLDLTKKRESRVDVKEAVGAIIAEDIALPGEATPDDAPKARTKKAKAERERTENVMLVKEGDELTEEVFNRLLRQGINTVKVFVVHDGPPIFSTRPDAIERGERLACGRVIDDVVNAGRAKSSPKSVRNLTDTNHEKESVLGADITKVSVVRRCQAAPSRR